VAYQQLPWLHAPRAGLASQILFSMMLMVNSLVSFAVIQIFSLPDSKLWIGFALLLSGMTVVTLMQVSTAYSRAPSCNVTHCCAQHSCCTGARLMLIIARADGLTAHHGLHACDGPAEQPQDAWVPVRWPGEHARNSSCLECQECQHSRCHAHTLPWQARQHMLQDHTASTAMLLCPADHCVLRDSGAP
jgi:hypothetical protein